MAKQKSIESINAEIAKTQESLLKAQERVEKLTKNLEALTAQRDSIEFGNLRDLLAKSGKSMEDLQVYLTSD